MLGSENRKEVTTEGGLDVRGNIERASEVVRELLQSGIPVSMFIDPDPDQLHACAEIGAPWVSFIQEALLDPGTIIQKEMLN